MTRNLMTAAAAILLGKAKTCRRAALKMEPSPARAAMERIADRWELMAELEGRRRVLQAANDT